MGQTQGQAVGEKAKTRTGGRKGLFNRTPGQVPGWQLGALTSRDEWRSLVLSTGPASRTATAFRRRRHTSSPITTAATVTTATGAATAATGKLLLPPPLLPPLLPPLPLPLLLVARQALLLVTAKAGHTTLPASHRSNCAFVGALGHRPALPGCTSTRCRAGRDVQLGGMVPVRLFPSKELQSQGHMRNASALPGAKGRPRACPAAGCTPSFPLPLIYLPLSHAAPPVFSALLPAASAAHSHIVCRLCRPASQAGSEPLSPAWLARRVCSAGRAEVALPHPRGSVALKLLPPMFSL